MTNRAPTPPVKITSRRSWSRASITTPSIAGSNPRYPRSWNTCVSWMSRARSKGERIGDKDCRGNCPGRLPWSPGAVRPGAVDHCTLAESLSPCDLCRQSDWLPAHRYTLRPVVASPGVLALVTPGLVHWLPGSLHHLFHVLARYPAVARERREPDGSWIYPAQCVRLSDC